MGEIIYNTYLEKARVEFKMARCPRCGEEVPNASKEWNYAVFHVRLFNCRKCNKSFKAYYRKGKLSHTIPKSK